MLQTAGEQRGPFWRGILLLATMLAAGAISAFAGPPLVTDDPGTPPRHGWEVNVSSIAAKSIDELLVDAPRFDVNFGLTDNSQVKVEFPFRFVQPQGSPQQYGFGDVSLGWKHRFWDEDERGLMASFNPQITTPTGRGDLGIGDGCTALLTPFEIGRHFLDDKLFVYGEVGYAIIFEDPRHNIWKFGVAVEWDATEKLQCLFEVGGFSCPLGVEPDEPFFNGGLRYHFNDRVALMASAGRSFVDRQTGAHEFIAYLGLQLTWGGAEEEDDLDTGCASCRDAMCGH